MKRSKRRARERSKRRRREARRSKVCEEILDLIWGHLARVRKR